MTRLQYIRGPGYVSLGGTVFATKGGITVRHNIATFRPETDLYGPLAARIGDRVAEISFTPLGTFTQAEVNKLWPLHNMADYVGGSIFGASGGSNTWADGTRAGQALIIYGRDGQTLTYPSAAVSKMPDISFSATKTLIGGVTVTALGDATASGWQDAWVSGASGTYSNPGVAMNPYTQQYSVVLSSTGGFSDFTGVDTTDGFTVSFGETTDPHMTDGQGTVDLTWGQIEPVVSFTPVNFTVAQLLTDYLNKFQGAGGLPRGSILPPAVEGSQLVLQGVGSNTALKLTMANPALTEHGLQWDTKNPRFSGMQFAFSRFASTDIPFVIVGG